MKTDMQLQKDVEDVLRWERHLSSSEITVNAKEGVVILSGTVNTFSKRQEAE
jgi:osmotically-inducible protein OsmY